MKRIFHITNGDYLAYQLEKTSVEGEIIVCREALVLGNLKAYSLEDFWKVRAESVLNDYTVEKKSYYQKVFPEF
ncbi:hypothetical protein SAMN05880574_10525 [Chryseobacterium sp. RU37D]|uniref:hypothetical protein n=1 Tax=Chryseobacterium sp. RU37D TaxID=1907397 RepID=UPI00095571F8|nr:hypothetical protein [Chryseobacterium sp. RU37D]SIQ07301.1 hypothetical protein SAMN05880574_10525 [Chryseobacterium sp. RU37D]